MYYEDTYCDVCGKKNMGRLCSSYCEQVDVLRVRLMFQVRRQETYDAQVTRAALWNLERKDPRTVRRNWELLKMNGA